MSVPRFRYRFSAPLGRQRIDIPAMLREWHAAMRLGMVLEAVDVDGEPLTETQLLVINSWIQSWAAWRASRLGYFRCWEMLEAVLAHSPTRRLRGRL